jgi:hypothetical protein
MFARNLTLVFTFTQCRRIVREAINPQNPVLYCQLGNVLHKTKNNEEALQMLEIASQKAPNVSSSDIN